MLILFLFPLSTLAQPAAADVQKFQLKNGMTLLVLEDHSIPNANMYLFWKVGSRNEVPGITGLSHFFEHMMFNGAKKYGPKMFDRTMEAAGGRNNAYTTEDVTVYTDWFPSSALETMFDLEADRIADLAIDDKMIESERGVVLSERSTGLENSNFQTLHEQVKSVAFFAHSYRWSVIGYESDIKSWTREDLQNYFDTYYAPNNCVAVIVGDVKTQEVKALAQKYFEPIPANDPPKKIRTIEPPQNGEKRLTVYKAVSTPNLLITHHVPDCSGADYFALDLLSSVLTSGNSSRLKKSLIYEQQLAVSLFSWMPTSFDPNLFSIYAIASAGVSPEKLEKALVAEIEKIAKEGITDQELEKVKNQKLMEFYHDIETINGKANNLGTYEVFFGDYKMLFEAPKMYQQITKEAIQKAAQTYFTSDNRTIGVLVKKEEEAK